MTEQPTIHRARGPMLEFANRTGIRSPAKMSQRYLWTDAFAVCNYLSLYHRTGDDALRELAVSLVDQVHTVLGRHRDDDARTGWISGLHEEEGRRHPTRSGLRIGKPANERPREEPYRDRLEWDRDGQYFHYLTKWMHALYRAGRDLNQDEYLVQAAELAKAAFAGFTYTPKSDGRPHMRWKMSIDLSYPLVPSMGHHDPLDGLVTFSQLQAAATAWASHAPRLDLTDEIAVMRAMCEGRSWVTDDPLGIGGLLTYCWKIAQLASNGHFSEPRILRELLEAAAIGLGRYTASPALGLPAQYRLPFRELGLIIGLRAVIRLRSFMTERSSALRDQELLQDQERVEDRIAALTGYLDMIQSIEDFWSAPENQRAATWIGHLDINSVMLATSLAPDAYLDL